MPRISDERRDERRAQIVDAALRCFLRGGYQGTSMADIIAESGLSAGAIYGYYASKQELLMAAAGRILDARRDELVSAGADGSLSPAAAVRMLALGVRTQAPLPILLQVWGEATVDAELRALVQTAMGRMRGVLYDTLAAWATRHPEAVSGDPAVWARAVTPVILAMLPGFMLQTVLSDEFDGDAFLENLALVLP